MANYYSKAISEKDNYLAKINKEITKARVKLQEAESKKAELIVKFEDDSVYDDFDVYEKAKSELPGYESIINDCQRFIDNKEEALAVYGIEFDEKIKAEQKRIQRDLGKNVKDSIEKLIKSYTEAQELFLEGNAIMRGYNSIAPRRDFSVPHPCDSIMKQSIDELNTLLERINNLL